MNNREHDPIEPARAGQPQEGDGPPIGSLRPKAPSPRPEAPRGEGASGRGEEEKGFFKIIVHSFFVVPFLIAVFCVLLFTAIKLLTMEQHSAYDFLTDIKTGGVTKRWQAAFELSKILANPKLVPREDGFSAELIDAFEYARHDDDRIRQYLALAMGRTGNPVFVRPLLNGLEEEKQDNLAAIIYSLGLLRQKEAAPALYPYVNSPQARIRSIAVVALGNIADPGSNAFLRKALADLEPNVRWGAAVSLARMGDAAGKDILLNMLDRGYWPQFTEVDAAEQNNLVLMAIEAAARLNDVDLSERIRQLAQSDSSTAVRSAALHAAQQ